MLSTKHMWTNTKRIGLHYSSQTCARMSERFKLKAVKSKALERWSWPLPLQAVHPLPRLVSILEDRQEQTRSTSFTSSMETLTGCRWSFAGPSSYFYVGMGRLGAYAAPGVVWSGRCPNMGIGSADRQLPPCVPSNFRPDFPAGLAASGESTHSWGSEAKSGAWAAGDALQGILIDKPCDRWLRHRSRISDQICTSCSANSSHLYFRGMS